MFPVNPPPLSLHEMQYFILFRVETLLLPYQDHLYILEVIKMQILVWVLWSQAEECLSEGESHFPWTEHTPSPHRYF